MDRTPVSEDCDNRGGACTAMRETGKCGCGRPWWRMSAETRAHLRDITGPGRAPSNGLMRVGDQSRYTADLAQFVSSYAESFPGLESRQKGEALGPAFAHVMLVEVTAALVGERQGLTRLVGKAYPIPRPGQRLLDADDEGKAGIQLVLEACAESEETTRAVLTVIESAVPGTKLGACVAFVGALTLAR